MGFKMMYCVIVGLVVLVLLVGLLYSISKGIFKFRKIKFFQERAVSSSDMEVSVCSLKACKKIRAVEENCYIYDFSEKVDKIFFKLLPLKAYEFIKELQSLLCANLIEAPEGSEYYSINFLFRVNAGNRSIASDMLNGFKIKVCGPDGKNVFWGYGDNEKQFKRLTWGIDKKGESYNVEIVLLEQQGADLKELAFVSDCGEILWKSNLKIERR